MAGQEPLGGEAWGQDFVQVCFLKVMIQICFQIACLGNEIWGKQWGGEPSQREQTRLRKEEKESLGARE